MESEGENGKSVFCIQSQRRLVQANDAQKREKDGEERGFRRAARRARCGGDHDHRRGGLRADFELVERQRPRDYRHQPGGEVRVHPCGRDHGHARGGERRSYARRMRRAAVYGAGHRLLRADDGAEPAARRLSRRFGHGAGRGRFVRDDLDDEEKGISCNAHLFLHHDGADGSGRYSQNGRARTGVSSEQEPVKADEKPPSSPKWESVAV